MQQPLPSTQRVGFEKTTFYITPQSGKCKYLLAGALVLSEEERECGRVAVSGKDGRPLPACEEHKDVYEREYKALGSPEQVPLMRMFGVDLGEQYPLDRMIAADNYAAGGGIQQ